MKFEKYNPVDEKGSCVIRTFSKLFNKDFYRMKKELIEYAKENGYNSYNDIEVFESYLLKNNYKKQNIAEELIENMSINYKNNLFLKKGSKYLAYKNNFEIINECNKKCEIKAIFIIKAIFDTSNYEFYIENNKYRNIKNITKYCVWSINNVLMTDDFELELNRKVINEFVSKINIPIYTVFGNKSDIIKKME